MDTCRHDRFYGHDDVISRGTLNLPAPPIDVLAVDARAAGKDCGQVRRLARESTYSKIGRQSGRNHSWIATLGRS